MEISNKTSYTKIISARIYDILSQVPEVAFLSRTFDSTTNSINSKKATRNKTVVVEFLEESNKLCIEVYVILYYSILKNIPEIVYDIQKTIKNDIESLYDVKVKKTDVTVAGVIYK